MLFGVNVTIIAFVALVGFAVAALVYAALFERLRSAAQTDKRVERVTGPVDARSNKKVDPSAARRKNVQQTLKEIEAKQKFRASQSTNPPLNLRLQQAGLKVTVGRFYMISAAAGLFALVFGFLILKTPPLLALGLGVVGGLGLPRFVVNFIRKRRQSAFIEELPNAVEVIVRGVKAGLPLNDCLRMIASEAKEPLRSEFRSVIEAQSIGIPIDEAIGRMYERMPLPEANFFAIVIAIQSKAGGNLSEALGNLARVLRDRKKMRAKIQAMSMEAKASASIIGSLPIIVMLLVYLTSPDYISILWTDPKGQIVLGASALTMLAGVMVMKKMISFDI